MTVSRAGISIHSRPWIQLQSEKPERSFRTIFLCGNDIMERIVDFVSNIRKKVCETSSELRANDWYMIMIVYDIRSKCISHSQLLLLLPRENVKLRAKQIEMNLTSPTASWKDITFSGAFLISSISSGLLTMTTHLSISGTLNVPLLYWARLSQDNRTTQRRYNGPCVPHPEASPSHVGSIVPHHSKKGSQSGLQQVRRSAKRIQRRRSHHKPNSSYMAFPRLSVFVCRKQESSNTRNYISQIPFQPPLQVSGSKIDSVVKHVVMVKRWWRSPVIFI